MMIWCLTNLDSIDEAYQIGVITILTQNFPIPFCHQSSKGIIISMLHIPCTINIYFPCWKNVSIGQGNAWLIKCGYLSQVHAWTHQFF
jgi:hypothetical protein